ncbi:MAG TPA: xanthine dehydrogenase family protein molybdopterin-binding subunit [Solirubrobacteraceae bacterium]|nr:xanthine dehydrogenase family protein molybdopterin-binding subunit [Solirubrobacteraceae bacterium]
MSIGAPVPRREDDRVLRGATRFIDDIEPVRTGHVAVVRSPHARALITGVSVPEHADGLIAVITAADLRGRVRAFPLTEPAGAVLADEPHPVLAGDEVRYAGQPVALVIAGSRAQAEDAAELVEVDYEPQDAVVAPRESERELMAWTRRTGDVEAAFARATHVARGRYALPRLAAVPMEARGCVAAYDRARDELTVWGSFQDPHRPLEQLAHILDRDPASIHVIVPDVGGAFGSKGVIAPEVAAVAAAAMLIDRPLKWTEDRLENLVGSYQGRGIEGDLELALDGEGRMLALRARLWADLGGYLLTTTAIPPHTAATLICGVYDIPVAEVRMTGMQTHKVPTGPYRGAGRPDAAYMIEALVEQAARELGADAVQLRRRNLVRSFPYPTATGLQYDSGDYARCLDLALEMAGERPAQDGAGPIIGRGVGMYVERAGGAWESATIALGPGGRFTVATSASAHGQGHETTFAQIAADRLCVPAGLIGIEHGDSRGPAGVGTFGSRSTAQAGSAVALAAEELIAAARPRAARHLGVPAGDVALGNNGFRGPGPDPVSWAELAGGDGEPLRGQARFASANVFSSGAYVAEVAIEPDTGATAVTRLIAVDDAGTLINPLLVHGQVIGGAVQALGECLTEEVVFDEDGQNRSGSLLDYSLLTAAEVPPILTGEVVTPSPLNPLGAKGAGEGGAVGALPAVANAVADALGGRHLDPPYTADRVWRALQAGRSGAGLRGDDPRDGGGSGDGRAS